MMFRGHAYRNLDTKGRLVLPPDFREKILQQSTEGRLVLTYFDGCVAGYPLPIWEGIEQQFAKLNQMDPKVRELQRYFIASAVDTEMDKQGRVLIPPHLRKYAGLETDIVLAGVTTKMEIWDQSRFEERRLAVESSIMENMAALASGGVELIL